MSGWQWHSLKGLDHAALREARLQAHYAVQWLARAARGYVVPRPNDGHTNLGWDDALGGFTTHPLPQGAVIGLDLAALTLSLWSGSDRAGAQSLSLDGRRDAEVRGWFGGALGALGLDAKALDAPSPYAMPDHPIAHGAAYAAAANRAALAEHVAWYANAHSILRETQEGLRARGIAAPPVRCWPHHFDLDSLVSLGSGASARSVGLGFCPGDDYYDEPYFYISAYPPPAVATLPALPPIGHWHTHHFTSAVTLADRINAAADPKAAASAFVQAAADILVGRS
jgi:hypothetical protein